MPRINKELKDNIQHYYNQHQTPTQIARLLKMKDPETKGRKCVHNYIKRYNMKRPALKKI